MNTTVKKMLSVILAIVMTFSVMTVAFAAKKTDEQKAAEQAAIAKEATSLVAGAKYYFKLNQNQNATKLLDSVDKLLGDLDLNSTIGGFLPSKVTNAISINLNSVNGVCNTIDGVTSIGFQMILPLLGNLINLDLNAWTKGLKRSATNDAKIIDALIKFVCDSDNAKVISKIIDGSLSLGIIDTFSGGSLINKLLGNDGVKGLLKKTIIKILYEEGSAEYNQAYAKPIDNFLINELLPHYLDEMLPGFSMNINSSFDQIIVSAFDAILNTYGEKLKELNIDLSQSENADVKKLAEIICLDGSKMDLSTIKFDKTKSFESQINNILGQALKLVFPGFTGWINGGTDKLSKNVDALLTYVAGELGVAKNPLAITKRVLDGVTAANEDVKAYVGDYSKWTSMTQALAAVLTNTAMENNIPVKASTNYETILGDMLVFALRNVVDLGTIASGQNIYNVLYKLMQKYAVSKGFADMFGLTQKTNIFRFLDEIMTKFVSNDGKLALSAKDAKGRTGSERFIKGTIENLLNLDFDKMINQGVLLFTKKYANESVLQLVYEIIQKTLKQLTGRDCLFAYSTANKNGAPLEFTIENSNLKVTAQQLLTGLGERRGQILPPLEFLITTILKTSDGNRDIMYTDVKANKAYYTGSPVGPATVSAKDASGKAVTLTVKYDYAGENNVQIGKDAKANIVYGDCKAFENIPFEIALGAPKATVSVTTSTARFNITALPGVAYKVLDSANKVVVSNATNGSTIQKLAAGKPYTYKLQASMAGQTATTTLTFATMPTNVSGVKVATNDKAATVTWTATSANGYQVFYSADGKTWKYVNATKNSATISGLKANTNYQFKVRAFAKNGSYTVYGGYSAVVKAITKPAQVTGLKQSKGTYNSATIVWNKVAGAVGYNVCYSYDGKKWSTKAGVKTNSFSFTGQPSNRTIKVKVQAVNSSKGVGAWSGTINAYSAPTKVTGVKVTQTTSTTAKLTWTKTAGATAWVVSYSTNGKNWKSVTVKTNSATITKLASNTNYYFKVRALKGVAAGVDSANVKSATKVAAPKLKASAVKKSSMTISWGKVAGANGYVVYQNNKKVATVKTTSFNAKSLKRNTNYTYKVVAYKTVNKKPVYGDYSAQLKQKTKLF